MDEACVPVRYSGIARSLHRLTVGLVAIGLHLLGAFYHLAIVRDRVVQRML